MREEGKVKQRLDVALVERGMLDSREKARRHIMAGEVRVGECVVDKASFQVQASDILTVKATSPYVGRGGYKLAAALDEFQVDPSGCVCLDVGASTGGFTDCLLQRGATKVFAIDVGHSQLDWKIRSDARVVVREKLNARHLTPAEIGEQVSVCVIDVSFISLTLILPPALGVLTPEGVLIALIKPQFELSKQDVGKGGIVRDSALHQRAIQKIETFVRNAGNKWLGLIQSPILGAEGNAEFLACIRK